MTLADAIRKGCEMRAQGYSNYFDQWGRSCALGAALEGYGGPFRIPQDLRELSLRAIQLHQGFFATMEREVRTAPCGCPPRPDHATWEIFALIPHLNDTHKWTRERIADWLDTLEDA